MGKGLVYDKLILFGDSITQDAFKQEHGFCVGAELQDLYVRRLDVFDRGFGGYNSDQAVTMIDRIIEVETTRFSKIALMVIFFGTNDSVLPPSIQHVPVNRFKDNVRTMNASAKAAGIPVILVGPAPFVDVGWYSLHPERNGERSTEQHREYCDAVAEVGKELGVPVVRLWYDIMAEVEGDETIDGHENTAVKVPLKSYFWDGLHFAGPAYKVELKGLLKVVKEYYPHLDPDKMEPQMPQYDSIPSLEFLKGEL